MGLNLFAYYQIQLHLMSQLCYIYFRQIEAQLGSSVQDIRGSDQSKVSFLVIFILYNNMSTFYYLNWPAEGSSEDLITICHQFLPKYCPLKLLGQLETNNSHSVLHKSKTMGINSNHIINCMLFDYNYSVSETYYASNISLQSKFRPV